MLVLGDAHATTPERRDALLAAYREVDPECALHVGDLGYYDLPAPTWFVAGNNEDFDVIEALRAGEQPDGVTGSDATGDSSDAGGSSDGVRNANLLASTVTEVRGLRVAGLSGNFAPTRYDRARSELSGERRRHFTHGDVEQAAALEDVDVFLTHEAPEGLFWYGYEPGSEHVTGLLETLEPDLCLVGHHHKHREAEIAGVRTVSLAPVWERYYTLDSAKLELTAHETPVDASAPE